MNKLFVAVFVVAIGASYGFFIDNLPFRCREDKDCGPHKCCLLEKMCVPKIKANFPCGGPISLFKCGCDDGLECKVTQVINISLGEKQKTVTIRQCRATDENVVPEEIEYDTERSRQKRFLPDITGITGAIGGAVGGVVDTIFRRCTDNGSECGEKRCCASTLFGSKRCIVPFPIGTPCPTNGHCCGEGLECRSLFTVTTSGGQGGPTKRPIDLKFCRRASEAVTPPTEVEIDE